VVAVAILVLIFVGPKETDMEDIDLWRWIWVGAFVVLGIGEMITAGLFMLPFAIGAGAAAILAWFEVAIWAQLLTFLLVSIAALWGMRRFAWRTSEPSYAVGAKRYVDAVGTVTEVVNRVSGTGRVRLDTEQWRATTDTDSTIEAGTEVTVVTVRGARLVVTPRSDN
jgi:membrane protein implicated in regulation of membrane protease activity